MVHFDAQLQHVKLFLSEPKPAAVSRDESPEADTTTTDTEGESDGYFGIGPRRQREMGVAKVVMNARERERGADVELARRIECCFLNFSPKQEAYSGGFNLEPCTQLRLSSLELLCPTSSGLSAAVELQLSGTVLVRNLSFSKWLTVRFTLDDWQTVNEVSGKWSRSIWLGQGGSQNPNGDGNGKTPDADLFTFSIKLSDHLKRIAVKTLLFCIRFSIPGSEWWDNNHDENYIVKFSIRRPPQNREREQRERARKGERIEGLPVPSSPEPEELVRRLNRLTHTHNPLPSRPRPLLSLRSDPTVSLEGANMNSNMLGARPVTSSVPFPAQEREANATAWLERRRSNTVAFSVVLAQNQTYAYTAQKRSYTYPNSNASFPLTPSPSSHPTKNLRVHSRNFSTTLFAPGVSASFGRRRGCPRDYKHGHEHEEREREGQEGQRRMKRISLDSPPVYALPTSSSVSSGSSSYSARGGSGGRRERNHVRSLYFDSCAESHGEMGVGTSTVKRTPPGTPGNLLKSFNLPVVSADQEGVEESETDDPLATFPSSTSEGEQEQDIELPVPTSLSSSSNETITLESHLDQLKIEIQDETETEIGTPGLVSTPEASWSSASTSPSVSEDPDEVIMMMRPQGRKEYASLTAKAVGFHKIGGGDGLAGEQKEQRIDEDEQKRQYSAFLDRFCFFTGDESELDVLNRHSSHSTTMAAMSIQRSPLARQANSESHVDTLLLKPPIFSAWQRAPASC